MRNNRNRRRPGFTLVELLVVVSIIALLIAILLPNLKKARDQAKAVACASNAKAMANAVASHLVDQQGSYPVSYAYPRNKSGAWDKFDQNPAHPFGYLHWSHFLYQDGKADEGAFQCPNFVNGGAPRTNPGRKPSDWEPNQVDQNDDSRPNDLLDKQAPRISYGANAAIIPRNKFTSELSGGQRVNVLVRENRINRPGDTILLAEFLNNWRALGILKSGGVLSKSHRPINVFYHVASGFNEYLAPPNSPGFIYGTDSDQTTYGLLPSSSVRDKVNILDYTSGIPQINAVGRHHPGGDKKYGGTANFLFVDGHVDRMTALQTMEQRKWGDRYYGITGENQVLNMSTLTIP